MHLSSALLLFLVVARSTAELSCSRGGIMTSCIMPIVDYMLGPEGLQMTDITDVTAYTEELLTDICRMGRMALKCFGDHCDHCVPFMPDVGDFFGKSAALMKRCEQPGFYNKARSLLQCTTKLNQTPGKAAACYNAAMRMTAAEWQKLRPPRLPRTGQHDLADLKRHLAEFTRQFSSGKLLDVTCCNTQFTQTCIGTEIADKCGQDAQKVFDDFTRAFLNAYDCSQERLDTCPSQTDPSAEDYESQNTLDQVITELFGGSSLSLA